MSSVKITIKPKGLIAFSVLTAALSAAAVSQVMSRQQAAEKTSAAKAVDEIYDNDGEREDAALISRLNNVPGQAREWLFLGPLMSGSAYLDSSQPGEPEKQIARIISTPYLPDEAKYQAHEGSAVNVGGKSYTWKKFNASAFDFKKMYASPEMPATQLKNVLVYGVTYIDSPVATKKLIRFRSDDGAVIWINGARVHEVAKMRGIRDEDQFPVDLRKGRNTVLIKVSQWGGGWGMSMQLDEAP